MSFDFHRNRGKRKLAIFPLLTLVASFLFLPFVSQAKLINLGGASDAIYVGGNVGIGTTAPGQKLQVNGIIYANNSANAIQVNNAASSRAVYTDNFNFYSPNSHNSYTWLRNSANTWTFQGGVGGDDWTQAVQIYLQPVGTAGANDKLIEFGQRQSNVTSGDYKGTRIVNYTSNAIVDGFLQAGIGYFSGNVGLGLSNPAAKLQINSGATPGIINSGSTQLSALGGGGNLVVMTDNTGTLYSSSAATLPSPATSGSTIRSNGTAWIANTQLFNNGTSVGVGTTNPAQALDVNGVINAATGYRIANSSGAAGNYLRSNGTNFVTNTIQASDVPTLNQNTTGYAGLLIYEDNRQISPSELAANRLKFGFTAYNNNNAAPYADFLHLRSYQDSSGGSDNLLVFNKSGLGMRLYQQAFGSTTAYTTYKDIILADNTPTANYLLKYTSAGNTVSAGNSLLFDNGSNVGIGLTNPGAKLQISSGATPGFINSGSTQLSALGGAGNVLVMADNNGTLYGGGTLTSYWAANSTHIYNTNSGNVGVGTTTANYKLSVQGDINFTGNLLNNGTPFTGSKWTTNGTSIYYNTGNVGIGTTNPSTLFHIEGVTPSITQKVVRDTTSGLAFSMFDLYVERTVSTPMTANIGKIGVRGEMGSAGVAPYLRMIGISATAPSDAAWYNKFNLAVGRYGMVGVNPLGNDIVSDMDSNQTYGLKVYNRGAYINGDVHMFSNVGIGTTAPLNKLDVTGGSARVRTGNRGFILSASTSTAGLAFLNYGVRHAGIFSDGSDIWWGNASTNENSSDIWTKLGVLTSTGNMGIGLTNPSAKLHVVGATGLINTGSTQLYALGGAGNRPVMVDNTGTLYTGSGMIYNRTAVNNIDYTALTSDYIIAYTNLTANRTVTLPSPCTAGQTHIVVNETGSAYNVVVDPAGAATISGMANIALKATWSIPVYCNGTNWFIY